MNTRKHIHQPRADKLRAGFYYRVSRANGRDADELEKHTISEQRELALGLLPQLWEMVERSLWGDVNVSGKNFDRPGLHALYDAIRAGEINGVAVGYLSRFGRNAREVLENVETLRELGATLFIGKERLTIVPDDDDPMTNLLLTILAAIAELERAQRREQLGRANRVAQESGTSIQVPYGYRRSNGAGSPLEFDESKRGMPEPWTPADVVRHIFDRRGAGVSSRAIADELNDHGIPTPTALEYARGQRRKPGAKRWQHNTVIGIAECHTYRGVIPRGVEFVKQGKKRRAVRFEFLPGDHPALIDPDSWEAAQREHAPAIRNGKLGGALLSGLVRCGSCSQTMKPNINGQGYLTYACRGRTAGCSVPVTVTRAGLERYVLETLLERQDAAMISQHQDRAELAQAELEAAAAQRRLDSFDRYADPDEWGDGFMSARRARVQERDELEHTAARLRASLKLGEQRSLEGWDELPLDERQAALGALLDAVVVWRTVPGDSARDFAARTELCFAGRAPFELSASGRTVAPRSWPRD